MNNSKKFMCGCWLIAWVLLGICPALAPAESEPESYVRPWESRPYEVLVWLCDDQSPEITSVLPTLARELSLRAELADPSAWRVQVQPAPPGWRETLIQNISHAERIGGVERDPDVAATDKLMAVCLRSRDGRVQFEVRELDVHTSQWGALVQHECPLSHDLNIGLFAAIERVFMPLARIERVADDGLVLVRARAINACLYSDIFDANIAPIENSPVWVRPEDRLLPIIRHIDRSGNLAQLEPIPFTYLTVESQEGPRLLCQVHSRQRLPLGGRSSKRAQKLALVIRPPDAPTQLTLVSRDDTSKLLSGYEIFSRPPDSKADQDSEFLGLTDWHGKVEIPPAPAGLRLIYVKRGSRLLLKLPIIPGLYQELMTTVPDDEARLASEGVTRGFQIEILNLVAQRELFQSQIRTALKQGRTDEAKMLFQQFQKLEPPQNLKLRLADEETRLRDSTFDKRELEQIRGMFGQLTELVNRNLSGGLDSELQAAIQKQTDLQSDPSQ